MRRQLLLLLVFTLRTGRWHPHLSAALGNYWDPLGQMPIPEDRISERPAEVEKETGFDAEGFDRILQIVFSESQ